MIQNEKDLLLKDLCARLPYGVIAKFGDSNPSKITNITQCIDSDSWFVESEGEFDGMGCQINNVKPYLFPISSMTVEQKEFIKNKFCYDWDIDDHPYSLWTHCIDIGDIDELIDWFHKNHIDYRGLIAKDLALDATGKNIY